MIEFTECCRACNGEEDGADAEGYRVVEAWKEHRRIAEHDEAVAEVPQGEFARTVDGSEGEIGEPRLIGGLQ